MKATLTSWDNPSGSGAPGNNMVLITTNEYDDDTDGGNGLLTEHTQYATATETRVTAFSYDYRGRRLTTDGELDFFQQDHYDNLSRIIKTERYNTTANGHLIARSETKYAPRGRVYQRLRYGTEGATPDGQSLQIGGLDVWKHEWRDTNQSVRVKDRYHYQDFTFSVYEMGSAPQVITFAAGEFSNCIWGFTSRPSRCLDGTL